jgi:hypothetical protein
VRYCAPDGRGDGLWRLRVRLGVGVRMERRGVIAVLRDEEVVGWGVGLCGGRTVRGLVG